MEHERDDLDGLGVPNCPGCLTPLTLDEVRESWRCDDCGLVMI